MQISAFFTTLTFLLLPVLSPAQENAFENGEHLRYEIRYGWIKGGYARVKLIKTYHKERMYWHSTLRARTTGWVDKLYNIREHYESYFHPQTGQPVTAIRDVEEGPRYKRYNKVHFNQQENYLQSPATGKMQVPENIYDVVAVFYAMRNSVLRNIGHQTDTIRFNLYFDKEVYNMRVLYRGKETIDSPVGRIRCMKFIPLVVKGRVFDSKEDVTLWISDDKNLIPIRAQMKLLIGSFRANLIGYQQLRFPLKRRNK